MKTMSISPESFSSRSGLGGFERGEVLHYGRRTFPDLLPPPKPRITVKVRGS